MNRTELIVATAVILFATFALGWFAGWLVNRFTRVTRAEIVENFRNLPLALKGDPSSCYPPAPWAPHPMPSPMRCPEAGPPARGWPRAPGAARGGAVQ